MGNFQAHPVGCWQNEFSIASKFGFDCIEFILDFNDVNQPNQRHDILLTMAYGKPTKFFQIQLNDVLKYQDNALFFGRPNWVGEVDLPKGILY